MTDYEIPSEPAVPDAPENVGFARVFDSERDCVETRRAFLRWKYPHYRPPQLEASKGRLRRTLDVIGLSLSGGGIRSAAFCLGVLQALDASPRKTSKRAQRAPSLLERIDYISTVSGGGYIGSSLTTGMTFRAGRFPFGSRLDQEETVSIKHIRDHSNYLLPNGWLDGLDSFAIYLRGLLANFIILLAPLLFLAVFTIYCSSTDSQLTYPKFYRELFEYFVRDQPKGILNFDSFAFTKLLFAISLFIFVLWGLAASVGERLRRLSLGAALFRGLRSLRQAGGNAINWIAQRFKDKPKTTFWDAVWAGSSYQNKESRPQETGSRWVRAGGYSLLALLVCAFFEAQPWILKGLFVVARNNESAQVSSTGLAGWMQVTTITITAVATAISLFAEKLAKLSSYYERVGGKLAYAGKLAIKAGLYLASAAIPLVIWWVYLMLSYWGIASEIFCKPDLPNCSMFAAPGWLYEFAWLVKNPQLFLEQSPTLAPALFWLGHQLQSLLDLIPFGDDIVFFIGKCLFGIVDFISQNSNHIAGAYFLLAIFLILIALVPTLNANSLHRLYRDRLRVAFIFVDKIPERAESLFERATRNLVTHVPKFFWRRRDKAHKPSSAPSDGKVAALDSFLLSQILARYGPYHLLNTALNIQGSRYANQRGRNAEFFMFSRNYVGSEATGYVATKRMEAIETDLNLATAMAVSGAAASANMGSSTIRPLTPTLAILNVRLGYWIRNPMAAVGDRATRFAAWLGKLANISFFLEMFGLLNEKSYNIYLTDGGHIENLGLYELLKRRCKLIIAVDSEADPTMTFASLVRLQRHARIDLGTRIELPWQAIRNASLETASLVSDGGKTIPDCDRNGPHAALGVIRYPHDEIGYLLYLKASMSGDENDYVVDYKRRFPLFPHESTGDQFFTEEQFEAYRALGFHSAFRLFSGEDSFAVMTEAGGAHRLFTWKTTGVPDNPLPRIKKLLRL